MTATTAERTDLKAGYCGRCRAGDHALCASPAGRCACTGKAHPNRPSARPKEAPVPAAAAQRITAVPDDEAPLSDVRRRAKSASSTAKAAPVWELVKAAPPPSARKQTPAELAKPLLEAIVESGDSDWWRIALFGTPHAAGRVKAALVAEFPEDWEWKSARDEEGRPAVFVRRVGGAEG